MPTIAELPDKEQDSPKSRSSTPDDKLPIAGKVRIDESTGTVEQVERTREYTPEPQGGVEESKVTDPYFDDDDDDDEEEEHNVFNPNRHPEKQPRFRTVQEQNNEDVNKSTKQTMLERRQRDPIVHRMKNLAHNLRNSPTSHPDDKKDPSDDDPSSDDSEYKRFKRWQRKDKQKKQDRKQSKRWESNNNKGSRDNDSDKSPPSPDPSDPEPDPLNVFDYIMLKVIRLTGTRHQLYEALVAAGYREDMINLSEITGEEINALRYYHRGGYYALTPASKSHLRVWKAFIHYEQSVNKQTYRYQTELFRIGEFSFNTFRREVFPVKYNNGPIPPGPDANWAKSLKSTKADTFKKGIKRDITAFPTLKQDTPFDHWKRRMIAQAKAQDCGDVLSEDYVPLNSEDIEEFQLKQIFMYSVFTTHLLSDKGKELVRLHEDKSDAQRIFIELTEHHTTATLGDAKITDLMSYITTTRLGNDSPWNGTTHAFVLHFQQQMRLYNQYNAAHSLHESMMLVFLQNAVTGVKELDAVKTTARQLAVSTGKELNYDEYSKLLKNAALVFDKAKAPTAGRTKRRSVYETDIRDTISFDIDTPLEHLSDSFYDADDGIFIDVNETARVPHDRWGKLSDDAKKIWSSLAPSDRATLLGVDSKPSASSSTTPTKKPPPRSFNLHDISAHDYLQLRDEFLSQYATPVPSLPALPTSVNKSVRFKDDTPDTAPETPSPDTSAKPAQVDQADMRRMLAANQHEAMLRSPGGSDNSPGFFQIGDTLYGPIRENKMHSRNPVYRMSQHARIKDPGALVDRGSNGGVGGSDVTVLSFYADKHVDIVGLNDHMMNDIRLATVAGVVNSNVGPIIIVMHHYAYTGKGATIHSSGQWEYYGAKVDDSSMVVGGTQCITLAGGIKIPLDIINGLPRLPLRPMTARDKKELPMIHVTLDPKDDWDPRVLDKIITNSDDWYANQDKPDPKDWPPNKHFDEYGEFTLRETYRADTTFQDLQDNFPLGPLEDYDVPPPLLPRNYCSSSDSSTVPSTVSCTDSLDGFIDDIVYETHKTKIFEARRELEDDLDPTDLAELEIEFKRQEFKPIPDPAEDRDWSWDLWNASVEVNSHILTSFPTT